MGGVLLQIQPVHGKMTLLDWLSNNTVKTRVNTPTEKSFQQMPDVLKSDILSMENLKGYRRGTEAIILWLLYSEDLPFSISATIKIKMSLTERCDFLEKLFKILSCLCHEMSNSSSINDGIKTNSLMGPGAPKYILGRRWPPELCPFFS